MLGLPYKRWGFVREKINNKNQSLASDFRHSLVLKGTEFEVNSGSSHGARREEAGI